MTQIEQKQKAVGRRKARDAGMIPDQHGRMRERIVKDAISPRALAVHSPRMRALGRRRRYAGEARKEEARQKAERRRWQMKRERPSFFQRVRRKIQGWMKGRGHR